MLPSANQLRPHSRLGNDLGLQVCGAKDTGKVAALPPGTRGTRGTRTSGQPRHTHQWAAKALTSVGSRGTHISGQPRHSHQPQWSKSGSSPTCAYVVGCIVSKHQNDALQHMIYFQNKSLFTTFVKDMLEVAANPSRYLPFDSWSFLQRYLAGGVFLAHADWLPLRWDVLFSAQDPRM